MRLLLRKSTRSEIIEKPSHFITIKLQINAWLEAPFLPKQWLYLGTKDKSKFKKRES